LKEDTAMTDRETETAPPPAAPQSVLPVIDYPTRSAGNPAGTRALLFGLLGFVPFVTGALAIRYGRRGLAAAAAEPRAGGAGKSRAGIVLGVVSLVAWTIVTLALPSAIIKARRRAMYVQCASNLRQIGMAAQMYAIQNRGFLPATLDDIVTPSFVPVQVLICPAANGDPTKPPASSGKFGNYSYVYLGAGRKIQSILSPSTTPLAYELPTNHAGDHGEINVLYVDGHVETLWNPAARLVLALTPGSSSSPASQPTSQPPTTPSLSPEHQSDINPP
jgi:prepilin-type processing-associated H-X9-DG protein